MKLLLTTSKDVSKKERKKYGRTTTRVGVMTQGHTRHAVQGPIFLNCHTYTFIIMGGSASVTAIKGPRDRFVDLEKAELVMVKTTLIDEDPCALEANPFPQFKYYTTVRLKRDELFLISGSRKTINSVPLCWEFDNIFFRALHDSRPPLEFSHRPFAIKKQFMLQITMIIAQDYDFYRPFVKTFVTRYETHGVSRPDCK
jgi:hypothetical protein